LVKAADLGYMNKNLEEIPSKEEQKKRRFERAIQNLATAEPPERITRTELPSSLQDLSNLLGD
jgi:hypothetical protein